jgi:hypothetical protein
MRRERRGWKERTREERGRKEGKEGGEGRERERETEVDGRLTR